MSRPHAPISSSGARPIVLGTKLAPPPVRPEHIARGRLFQRLDEATERPLTLVAAPTGFGKTTLLGGWARRTTRRTAWVTISANDSDTVRLVASIVAAVRRADALGDDGDDVERDLVSPGIDVTQEILPRLFGALDDSEPLVLILDDYHLLAGAPAHHLVATLVAEMPESLRVVIGTRADPDLPLGRLRATGAMEEIRSDQLRFDPDEADRFLNGALALHLDGTSLATIESRTEGWPAGLYLAALSLRDRRDPSRFIAEFGGSSRHVVDYLAPEVLTGLEADDRTFLLRTSILERLNGSLCDAVAGMPGSAARLRHLERQNLFIVPLDEPGAWLRYHRLFAELLRTRLADESPDLEPELHRRAAAWYAEHGPIEAAVGHAIAAGDRERAATIVVESWNDFARSGEFQTLERLLGAVGDGGGLAGPLAMVEALAAGLLGRPPDTVRRLVARAGATGWTGPMPGGPPIEALAAVAAAFLADDLDEQRAAASGLIDQFPDGPDLLIGSGRVGLGLALAIGGDAAGAMAALEPLAELPNNPNLELSGAGARAIATSDLGDPGRAEAMARASLARAEAWGLAGSRFGGVVRFALGHALVAQGRHREALEPLERALESWGVPGTLHRAETLFDLAAVYAAVGETTRARAAAREARQILEVCPNAGAMPARLQALERRLRLATRRVLPEGDRPSEAEARVLRLLATPLSAREIGATLFVSPNTVKSHTRALYRKLGTSSRGETVARARELGLL